MVECSTLTFQPENMRKVALDMKTDLWYNILGLAGQSQTMRKKALLSGAVVVTLSRLRELP